MEDQSHNEVSLNSKHDVRHFFEKIVYTNEIPQSFPSTLTAALQVNPTLEKELLSNFGLPYWDTNRKVFTEDWHMEDVYNSLINLERSVVIFCEWSRKLFGDEKVTLMQKTFLEANTIFDKPKVQESELSQFFCTVYPYLLQRIKMWGCHALYAQNIYNLIDRSTNSTVLKGKNPICSGHIPISRFDFVSFLLGTSDCIVASDIVRVLSKFLLAMPLVVRDLQTDQYILLVPYYRDVIIKWEASEGKIIENYLFKSPFKMIVCLRVGDNGRRPGKSTILNQLIKKECFFSSRGEPGGKHGKPCALDGAVEFTWLTKETCSDALWIEVLQPHYAKGTNELILLANLHGDINNFEDFLVMFESFSPNYLIFVMPSAKSEQNDDIILRHNALLHAALLIYVDQDDEFHNEHYTFNTSMLCDYENIRNVIEPLAKSIGIKPKLIKLNEHQILDNNNYLQRKCFVQAEKIYTAESHMVIEFVRKHKCKASKRLLETPQLMDLFLKIFRLSRHEIRKALAHLETELSSQSNIESQYARECAQNLRRKCLALFESDAENLEKINEIEMKINDAQREVDEINFGLEHFFREVSTIFKRNLLSVPTSTSCHELPNISADLLLNGTPIELLNGDNHQLSVEWIQAICKCINNKQRNLRVFVVSIIGLQSSGKSTLLNALFSCKFAVSVGRCSRGLFIRLAFLHDHLKRELGFDAFLLVDTEGLGSPEKMNDKEAAQSDRRMATLAMGISNLTIINVMGEAISEMTEILQIVIVAMARLEKSDMASDILLVQHLQEKNEIRSSGGKNSFCKALKESFDLTHQHSTVIGALDNAGLKNLIQRIQSENFLKQFNPFKDGSTVYAPPSEGYHDDVVDLYKTILEVSKKSAHALTLVNWSKLVASYWSCAKDEKFASQFKNAREMIAFLDHEQKLESIKNAITHVYNSHCSIFEVKMRQQINKDDYDSRAFFSQNENGLTDLPNRCSAVLENGETCRPCKAALRLIDELTREVAKTDREQKTIAAIKSYSFSMENHSIAKMTRFFQATIIENKFCNKYGEFINSQLKKILESNKTFEFSKKQRKEIVVDIWSKLEYLSTNHLQSNDEPIQNKIETEIKCAYGNNQNFMELFKGRIDFEEETQIMEKTGISEKQLPFENLCTPILALWLQNIAHDVIPTDNTFRGFEPTMVTTLKSDIDNEINKFECRINQKCNFTLRWKAHAYTCQKFAASMELKQIEWDSKNDPRVILKNKEQTYMKEIETRLELGFTAAGDGRITAETLCNAIKKRVKSVVERMLVKEFKTQEWAKHTESVRLKYFYDLAQEVRRGQKEHAVEQFLWPTPTIEKWFKQLADTYDKKKASSTFSKEFERRKSNLLIKLIERDLTKVKNYIQHVISKTDEKYALNGSNYTVEDEGLFFDTLTTVVRDFKCNFEELEDTIVLPSKNKEVMDLLGCTACCPLCNALCWMSRGHAQEDSSGKLSTLHRSCHQPVGLGATGNYKSKELRCDVCNEYENSDQFRHIKKDVKWTDVKLSYPKWTFENHPNVTFQSLMKWFMGMLHGEVAQRTKFYKPALNADLKKHKCVSLDIENILRNIGVQLF